MKYTFDKLQEEIGKNIYIEDDGMTRITLASVIVTRLQISDPIWLIIIGASSSGKSQVLRPIALTDSKFIHRVDDLTENTLLSGSMVKKGEANISLLQRIGKIGILVISDLTTIFSKSSETRNTILGQLRMVYDGEMTKYTGNRALPIKWKGAIGILSGSTPSIYTEFEEVADMGERFIYYRMKPYNIKKATERSLERKLYGSELDTKLSLEYSKYIKDVVSSCNDLPEITDDIRKRIMNIAIFAEKLRAPIHYDRFEKAIDKIPVPAMPMRVALQLLAITKGLMVMRRHDSKQHVWEMNEEDMQYVEWCAYSLANEERRACLREIAQVSFEDSTTAQNIADKVGLSTSVISMNLQHLAAVGVLKRMALQGSLRWSFTRKEEWKTVRKLEEISGVDSSENRDLTMDELGDIKDEVSKLW